MGKVKYPDPVVWTYQVKRFASLSSPDGEIHTYRLSTFPEFFRVCPNPGNCSPDELAQANIKMYYHSLTGPAVHRLEPVEASFYYINGEPLEKEVWESRVAKLEFDGDLEKVLK